MNIRRWTSFALLALASAPAAAQTEAEGQDTYDTEAQEARDQPSLIVRAAELRGMDVENDEGRVGDIRDVYINPRGQLVYYVVEMASGRFTAPRYFAVPPACITPDPHPGESRMVVDMPTDELVELEGFDPDERPWPASASTAWCQRAPKVELPSRPTESEPLTAGSSLAVIPAEAWNLDAIIGRDVTNAAGEQLGRVGALGLDLLQGRVGFWILSADGGADLVAAPWEAITFFRRPGEDEESEARWVVDATETQVERAQEFDPDEEGAWSDRATPEWLETQYESWGLPIALYYRWTGARPVATSPLGR
jgi:sporulation protein YlmC with PRC-barrel domain